jgi:hypothetical protein
MSGVRHTRCVMPSRRWDVYQALPGNWGEAAAELLRVETSGEWKDVNPTFSLYISEIARVLNKARPAFWRLLVAGRTYNSLRTKFDPTGAHLPPLESVRGKPSPESLELVSKIERVAPSEVLESVQRQIMEGHITRDELRRLWETYRPVLGGQTKRGRGVKAPRYNALSPRMRSSFVESNILAIMARQGPDWLGIQGPAYLYRVIHLSVNKHLRNLQTSVPDVVVLLAENEDSPLVLHGVGVGSGPLQPQVLRHYEPNQVNVDYLWFASPKRLSAEDMADIPEEIGLLIGGPTRLEVVRPAKRSLSGGKAKENLLRMLLREVSRNT